MIRLNARAARRAAALTASVLLVASLPQSSVAAQSGEPPSPSEVLGFEVGADSTLADWRQITRYLRTLATGSPYIRLDTIGRTTLDKPLLLVTMTAPSNQRRLAELRRVQARLADPRGLTPRQADSLARHTPAVILVNNNIHSTEIASSQFSMLLAYQMATDARLRTLLDSLVVLMTPSANPDGLDTVVAWYRQYRGTEYEDGPLPWLYHPYVGHDNNRDWYMLTQAETKAITRVLYREWFPEVVWDVHQMGNSGPRMFLPPFEDPVNPNLDPILVEATNLTGTAMALAIYDADRTGVVHQRTFDLWWHGGFRTVPARHNMVGILSEAASARLASPIFQEADSLRQPDRGVTYPEPWDGGWWRLRDIIDYELLAARGLFELVASQREAYIRRFVALGRRAVARGAEVPPFAFLVPPAQRDPHTAALLANTLIAGGIEIRRAEAAFEAGGRRYPPGTLVVPMAQPFRAHVKDLLEAQHYPERTRYPGGPPDPPYDVAGWTLPLQMGVEVPAVPEPFEFAGRHIERAEIRPGTVHGSGRQWVLANRAAMESRTIAAALERGATVWVRRRPTEAAGSRLEPGAVVLEHLEDPAGLEALIREDAARYGFDAWGATGLRPSGEPLTGLPRIGLYKPWTASMDEGWTRWVFEQYGIPYRSVTDGDIRAGDLGSRFDVLVLPDLWAQRIVSGYSHTTVPPEFAGGIGEAGAEQVRRFVEDGGVLVALDGSSSFAISRLNLPVRNALADQSQQDSGSRFYAPGSIFGVTLEPGTPITSGMGDSVAVFFARSLVFEAEAPARVLARYPAAPLRSGYALNQEVLVGKAALVDVPVGSGRAILFGFRPQHRGQTHATFKLLFNAVLLSGLE